MSSIYADNVVAPWIQDNRWSTTGEQDDLLVISLPDASSADGPVLWHSAVSGIFELHTVWDRAQERLNQTSVYIEIPGFGRAVLFSDKNIDMKNPKPISVSLPRASVYGDVQFVYGSAQKKDIELDWNITVPWFGHLKDGRSLFPTERSSPFLANKLQNVEVITDSEASALKEAPPLSEFKVVRDPLDKELILFDTSPEDMDQQSAAASFVRDYAGNSIVTVPVLSCPTSEGKTFDISFLGIFKLVGTIFTEQMDISAILYVKIPFTGLGIQLVENEIKGTLTEAIEAIINLALAQGSVRVSVQANSSDGHDLYINLDVEIKYFPKFQTGDLKLFTF